MFTRRVFRKYESIIEKQVNAAMRRFQARPAADNDETLNEGDIDDREDWEDEEFE